ncbi:MAG TPA: site-specific integrase, partial [Bacteroidia bacterium]
MKHKTFKTIFYLKQSKANKSGESPLYMRITIDGKRLEKSLNISILPKVWSTLHNKVIGNSELAKSVNSIIESYRFKSIEAYRKLLERGTEVTVNSIQELLFGNGQQKKTLIKEFELHNHKMKELLGIDFTKGTLTKYETTLGHVRHFLKYQFNLSDVSLNDVNFKFIADFEFFLKKEKKIANNTCVKYIKNLHKIIRICITNGYLDKDPFSNHRFRLNDVEKPFLTELELSTLMKKDLHTNRLDQVRDVFVFICFTGLSFSDVKKLTHEHIVKGIDGEDWIVINRTKTKVKSRIPLMPEAKSILEKYKSYIPLLNSNRVLPVLSNQKMNAYLKEIGDICGFHKVLTCHIGRHSFATLSLTKGVPLETVSKMLGHSSVSMSEHY